VARAGLEPVPSGTHAGWVAVVTDPEPLGTRSVRLDVDIGGRRHEVVAHGAHADRLRERLAGERVWLEGTVRPRPEDDRWLRRRRVVGVLAVAEVGPTAPGSLATRLANGYRRTIAEG